MFVFDRSALAVVVPLALLVAVVLWSNRAAPPAGAPQAGPPLKAQSVAAARPAATDQTLAVNLPSR